MNAAGGVLADCIARWEGSAWSALGSGVRGDYPAVFALAVDGSGNLYAGGHFEEAGGVPAANIARWDGSAWSVAGSGVSGGGDYPSVHAHALDGSALYAGGNFSVAGGVPSYHIARWWPRREPFLPLVLRNH